MWEPSSVRVIKANLATVCALDKDILRQVAIRMEKLVMAYVSKKDIHLQVAIPLATKVMVNASVPVILRALANNS